MQTQRALGANFPGDGTDRNKTSILSLMCALVVLGSLLLGYVFLGASAMMLIEGGEAKVVQGPGKVKVDVAKQLLDLINSEDPGAERETRVKELLSKFQNAVLLASQKGWKGGESTSIPDDWDFDAALLYAGSLVTTVGYGNIAPVTIGGQIFTMVYSLAGVPLALICISVVGIILARFFRLFLGVVSRSSYDEQLGVVIVPLWVSLFIMMTYLSVGAGLFTVLQGGKWSYIESFYFCFITLSTIGLGDYVYTAHGSPASIIYLLVGLSLVSMCFSLMQEEVTRKVKICIANIKNWLQELFKWS